VLLFRAAGLGLRASPRRLVPVAAGVLALAFAAVACAGPDGSTPPADASATAPRPASGSATATTAPGSPTVESIAGLELQVASYPVPEVIEGEGGAELAAMLETLGLRSADVDLEVAIDPAGTLAIGRWHLPGRNADAILSAWDEAVDGAWASETFAGTDALSGRGADGSRAWVTARDGLFLYIVTDDRDLAEAAAAAD
jgi:hypothetical protein